MNPNWIIDDFTSALERLQSALAVYDTLAQFVVPLAHLLHALKIQAARSGL